MTDLTNGLKEIGFIVEGFSRNGKHTKEYNMWLESREAPTPPEKVVNESIPFMQGSYDFSTILGERVYENRSLSYTFIVLNRDYDHRKTFQTAIENWLMKDGFAPLRDDHSNGYDYIAKCTSVDTSDRIGGLLVKIEFEAYPFKVSNLLEGNDIWDTFNFELDVAQITAFDVEVSKEVTLYNVGATSIVPTIIADASFTIYKGTQTYNVSAGETKSPLFRFDTGENTMTITGNGHIDFQFYKELI
ncbi:hypothetical protein [Paraliobacillus ryukyuensis]|uniref:hypothetical protein n=1 Tax=Paraliobacillus ryukyuensis TaxID=200904 RepID=UPI0009A55F4C|nr:hypothetical protein [Paraliobacillus ryukyuensis]